MSTPNIVKVTSAKYSNEDDSQQTQKDKRAAIYTESLKSISEYFGVSEMCALYLFHRSFRSRRKDSQILEWTVQLQNALVKADRCIGVAWDKIYFGYEEDVLEQHGIIVNEMPGTVFRWSINDDHVIKTKLKSEALSDNNGWTTVSKKNHSKRIKSVYSINLIRRPGLLI